MSAPTLELPLLVSAGPDERGRGGQMEAADLVRAAAGGDEDAWGALVDRYSGLLWSIARGYGFDTADAGDVVQTAWFRLVERLDTLHDPEHVGAWLATTVRRECLRMRRRADRVVLTDDTGRLDRGDARPGPDAALIASERDAALWRALHELEERCTVLLRTLMTDPPPSYEEISAALDIPVGSIGPTRARCLDRLRRRVQRDDVVVDAGDER